MKNGVDGSLCIFGEVLFDHFPDGSAVLGGAPFNVAWNLQALGETPLLISRIGRDRQGEEVLDAMARWGMQTSGIQRDPSRPTGRVNVSFVDGEPTYEIQPDCAYDAIAKPAVKTCSLLYHGSLALRGALTAQSLEVLRALQPSPVFLDVNLRPPWWQCEQLQQLLRRANWLKLNEEELLTLAGPHDDRSVPMRQLIDNCTLDGVIVTRGAAGASLLTRSGAQHQVTPEPGGTLVDTVGAGDAFSSVLLLGLLREWPLPLTLRRAQTFAQAVVGRRGATVSDPEFYRAFRETWSRAD